MKYIRIFIAHYQITRVFGAGCVASAIIGFGWALDVALGEVFTRHKYAGQLPVTGDRKHGTTTQDR